MPLIEPCTEPARQQPRVVPALRVAVVHDYLTQRGGAERVVLSLLEAFPGARLITSVYDPDATFPEFKDYAVETTWLDRVPVFRADPRRAMPLLPMTFSGVQLDDVDVVISAAAAGRTACAPGLRRSSTATRRPAGSTSATSTSCSTARRSG